MLLVQSLLNLATPSVFSQARSCTFGPHHKHADANSAFDGGLRKATETLYRAGRSHAAFQPAVRRSNTRTLTAVPAVPILHLQNA